MTGIILVSILKGVSCGCISWATYTAMSDRAVNQRIEALKKARFLARMKQRLDYGSQWEPAKPNTRHPYWGKA